MAALFAVQIQSRLYLLRWKEEEVVVMVVKEKDGPCCGSLYVLGSRGRSIGVLTSTVVDTDRLYLSLSGMREELNCGRGQKLGQRR